LNVLFLHVPVDASDAAIAIGVEATIELIRAVVVSGEMRRLVALQKGMVVEEKVEGEKGTKGVEFNA